MTLAPASHPTLPDPDPNNIHSITELFLDLYYRRFGPDKTSSEPLQPGSECAGWRSLLPRWIGQSTILDNAIKALATCFVGTQYQDEKLIDHARNNYLSALQMVQQVLSEPDSAQRKDLLATTLVMGSIELFMSNGGGASQLTHIDGATRLLHCSFENQDFEELHIHVLNQGLFECLSGRRRYPFSSPSYRSVVRQIYSVTPTYRNDLFLQWCEIIMPLPNVLSAADSVSTTATSSTPTAPAAILSILDDLAALEQSLAPWYETLKTSMPGPWTLPTAQISPESVPFPLQFMTIEICTLYCLYWMSQLLILDARLTLALQLPLNQASEVPTADLPSQLAEYASLVCRSVQFCTQNNSFAASENMFLPLYVVASYYMRQGDDDRMKWCVSAFGRIAAEQKIGYAIEKLDLNEQTVTPGAGHIPTFWDDA